MKNPRLCRGCGTEVPDKAPFGHCPRCLLELGFSTDGSTAMGTGAPTAGSRAFGDYELIEPIGRGGMGVVYKARQIRLNRLVALKMVNQGELASPVLIQRFQREAEAAANLHHPNIVPIYEIGELNGQSFYSMELIDGAGLDQSIKGSGFQAPMTEQNSRTVLQRNQEHTARILSKVARAVDHAHQHGVLHRDLKPSNIILDRSGEPHLTDFGVAKLTGHEASALTVSGTIVGTPSYMAPEQAAGQSKRATTAADVYSLGAILYTMLTGSPPFRAATPVETLRQVVEQDPRHPSTIKEGVDADLATIALKCLEKEPTRRYASASALAEDLERWLNDEPIQARRTTATERFWRWCYRNPKQAVLAGSVTFLLLVVAGGAVVLSAVYNNFDYVNRSYLADVHLRLDALYKAGSNGTPVSISSETRRALMGPPMLTTSPGFRFTLIEYVYEHPTNILVTLSPVLAALEGSLSASNGTPVAIDLLMCPNQNQSLVELAKHDLAMARFGPAAVVQWQKSNQVARIIGMQDYPNPLRSVFFVRRDGALARNTNADLKVVAAGHSIAFNDNSTTGYHIPRFWLATNGISAGDFRRIEILSAQRRVIDAVKNRDVDIGVGNEELLDKHPDLVAIKKVAVDDLGRCWVASPGLSRQLFNTLSKCLLGLTNKNDLRNLEAETIGFKVPSEKVLRDLETMMKDAARFDKPSAP